MATVTLSPATVESDRIKATVDAMHPSVRSHLVRAGETYMGVKAIVGDENFTEPTLAALADRILLELDFEPEHHTRDAVVSLVVRRARRLAVRTP